MPSVFIQALTDKVFEAMCDLTRHAKWAHHDITIEAGQEGPAAVGNTYTSSHKGAPPDQLTVTEMTVNERFAFHSVMRNNCELDFSMTSTGQGDGTLVSRQCDVAKMPMAMLPLRFLFPIIGGIFEKKLLNNMKADLEAGTQ